MQEKAQTNHEILTKDDYKDKIIFSFRFFVQNSAKTWKETNLQTGDISLKRQSGK